MVMKKRIAPLSVFFPSSILSDVPSLAEKTFKVGQIARAASIFRVDQLVVYPEGQGWRRDSRLIFDLLSYAEAPQYLRRRLFPLSPNLRYAGLIPPLRTPHHPLGTSQVEYREGFVVKSGNGGSLVDIGLNDPVSCRERLKPNTRVTMHYEDGRWEPIPRNSVPLYWGYTVALEERPLGKILAGRPSGMVIATSRTGDPISEKHREISDALKGGKSLALIFGSPREGLNEILKKEGASLPGLADMVVNIAPMQGTATIRTEEAIIITLAQLELIEGLASGMSKSF